jgi:hypothetical protein
MRCGMPSTARSDNMEILTKQDIARRLQALMLSRREPGTTRVPLSQIGEIVGICKATLYLAAKGEMSEATQTRLSVVLPRIEWGLLGFKRVGEKWQPVLSDKAKRPSRTRMVVSLTPKGPTLAFALQSPRPQGMPSLGSLLSKRCG